MFILMKLMCTCTYKSTQTQDEYLLVWHWLLIHSCPDGHSPSCSRNQCNLNFEAHMVHLKLEYTCFYDYFFHIVFVILFPCCKNIERKTANQLLILGPFFKTAYVQVFPKPKSATKPENQTKLRFSKRRKVCRD